MIDGRHNITTVMVHLGHIVWTERQPFMQSVDGINKRVARWHNRTQRNRLLNRSLNSIVRLKCRLPLIYV